MKPFDLEKYRALSQRLNAVVDRIVTDKAQAASVKAELEKEFRTECPEWLDGPG